MDKLIFIFMILLALFIVSSRNFKRVVIALATFSLLAAFCYLLYHAPDVALAEAVIGSALSTILYIIALKKHRTFYIYFSSKEKKSDFKLRSEMVDVVSKIMQYCAKHELEAQSVFTWEHPTQIAKEHLYDIILTSENGQVTVYGSDVELHVSAIREMLKHAVGSPRVLFATIQTEEEEE